MDGLDCAKCQNSEKKWDMMGIFELLMNKTNLE